MKKGASYFLILNLLVSIFAFGIIVNCDFISGDVIPSATIPAEGGFEEVSQYTKIFGEEGVGTSGLVEVGEGTGGKVTTTNYEGVWAGYGTGFVGNIVEGLVWAGAVYGMINMFGPMLGREK